jgi:hypothetical protein
MSLQDALRFAAAVRDDADLTRRIRELGLGTTIDPLVELGAERGMVFTAEELRKAYRIDWAMRAARYSPRNKPDR